MTSRALVMEVKPGEIEDLAAFFAGRLDEIRGLKGNRGFLLLTDETQNRAISASVWDSDEDAEAATETFRSHVAIFGKHLAGPPQVGQYSARILQLDGVAQPASAR